MDAIDTLETHYGNPRTHHYRALFPDLRGELTTAAQQARANGNNVKMTRPIEDLVFDEK